MRLLIITGYFAPELNGIGKYNGEMIRWLADKGYECTVITSYPYYPQWRVQEPYGNRKYRYTKEIWKEQQQEVMIYRCPQYIPALPSGKKRMVQDATFFFSSGWKLLQLLFSRKFDGVLTIAPSFLLGGLGLACKKMHGTKFIFHIQDLQIEAARNLNMIRSPWLIRRLFSMERHILKHADVISSISEGMIRTIKEKAGKEVLLFPNWADLNQFYPLPDRAALKERFGFSSNDKIVLYSGALGEKQGLESIVLAAAALRQQSDVKFLVCGSGPYRRKLEAKAATLKLSNIVFMPLQPADQFNSFLNMADIHLVIQKGNAGDLVMPSKLATIMAVGGVAIITANEGTSLYGLVKTHQAGILVKADEQDALNAAIADTLKDEKRETGINARIYAERCLSQEQVMTRFEAVLRR